MGWLEGLGGRDEWWMDGWMDESTDEGREGAFLVELGWTSPLSFVVVLLLLLLLCRTG
jgi:hypothetical protein